MSILSRVTILTLLYQTPGYLLIASSVLYFESNFQIVWTSQLYHFSLGMAVIAMNYSMYLMQSHNTKEYQGFLRFIYRIKVYNACFCCRNAIQYELEGMTKDEQQIAKGNVEDTMHGTVDLSGDTQLRDMDPKQIEKSIETTVY